MHRATLAFGLILLVWWIGRLLQADEPTDVPAEPERPRRAAPLPRARHHGPAGARYRVADGSRHDAEYLAVVAEFADDVARETLDVGPASRAARRTTWIMVVASQAWADEQYERVAGTEPPRRAPGYCIPAKHTILVVDREPIEPVLASQVALAVLHAHAFEVPPFLEAGLAAHVATYFDGTWTDEPRLHAWADVAAANGAVDPGALAGLDRQRLGDPECAFYPLLFVDMVAYAKDPGIHGLLGDFLRRSAEPGWDTPAEVYFDAPAIRRRWQSYLQDFVRAPVPTPSYR